MKVFVKSNSFISVYIGIAMIFSFKKCRIHCEILHFKFDKYYFNKVLPVSVMPRISPVPFQNISGRSSRSV